MRRRNVLGIVSSGLLFGAAGCSSSFRADGTDQGDEYTTFEKENASAASNCTKGTAVEPRWTAGGPGPIGGFELTISKSEVSMGEEFVIPMQNVTEQENDSGVKTKFDVQDRSNETWSSIYAREGAVLDEAIYHAPGDGFSWQFTASEQGFSAIDGTQRRYHVCGDVEPGAYRFIYWGVSEGNRSLAIPFEIS